jgi:GNAT superfamily N-acetyltransferase
LHRRVEDGAVPGLIGYAAGEPVAWCAVEPRDHYPGLARSRILQPVDESAVWSVSCLYVRSDERRRGRTVEMLRAAASYAKSQGATIVEGYPHEPGAERMAAAFAWTGIRVGLSRRRIRGSRAPLAEAADHATHGGRISHARQGKTLRSGLKALLQLSRRTRAG